MKPFNNRMLLERIKFVRKMTHGTERRPEELVTGQTPGGENLENRVTNMLHEIGIPAHIKGYHYLRDAIMMAVEDMDVLNAITKILYPTVAEKISDDIKPGRTGNPACYRGGMEPWKIRYTG